MDVNLSTERLIIRLCKLSDLEAVNEYASDEYTTRFMTFGPCSLEQTREYLTQTIASYQQVPMTNYDLAVCLKSTGERIGGINLIVRPLEGIASIGWILNKRYHRHGYMTEAAEELMRFGFVELGLHRIEACAVALNVCSLGVMEKLGMTREGSLRDGWRLKDAAGGGFSDMVFYGMLGAEYFAKCLLRNASAARRLTALT